MAYGDSFSAVQSADLAEQQMRQSGLQAALNRILAVMGANQDRQMRQKALDFDVRRAAVADRRYDAEDLFRRDEAAYRKQRDVAGDARQVMADDMAWEQFNANQANVNADNARLANVLKLQEKNAQSDLDFNAAQTRHADQQAVEMANLLNSYNDFQREQIKGRAAVKKKTDVADEYFNWPQWMGGEGLDSTVRSEIKAMTDPLDAAALEPTNVARQQFVDNFLKNNGLGEIVTINPKTGRYEPVLRTPATAAPAIGMGNRQMMDAETTGRRVVTDPVEGQTERQGGKLYIYRRGKWVEK